MLRLKWPTWNNTPTTILFKEKTTWIAWHFRIQGLIVNIIEIKLDISYKNARVRKVECQSSMNAYTAFFS